MMLDYNKPEDLKMASGIQTVSSSQSLINVYTKSSKTNEDLNSINKFVHFNENYYNYEDYTNYSDVKKESLRLTFSQQISLNNNIEEVSDVEQEYSQNILSDCISLDNDSTISSLKESPENIKNIEHKDGSKERGKHYHSNPHQPKLYQPVVPNYSHKNRHQNRGHQRNKYFRNTIDQERKVHGLMRRFQSRSHKLKVDISPEDLLIGGPWDSLSQSIWDVFVYKIEKEETYINKLDFWKTIFLFFKICLSNYGLYLVGSTMSGFALEGSDIDICLLIKPFSNEPRVDSLHHLRYLQHALLKNGLASEAELIMAKVPILKFKNEESGFDVDLNCNNAVGIQNTRLLYSYSQLDWRVRPLVVIVKIWAQSNDINNAKNMTISSYSWTLMVIHYLQCGVYPPVLPCLSTLYPEEFASSLHVHSMDVQGEIEGLTEFKSKNNRCLGDLLIGFFHYYSYFNYQLYAISVRTGSRLPVELCKQVKSPKNDPHQWKYLSIEEPFDLSNTARSVYDPDVFKHIKQVIHNSYRELACNKDLSLILPLQ